MGNNALILAGTQAAGADGTGLAWFAATGSTAPTDATTSLAAAFKNAGMITEDGLTAKFSESSKKIKAYGSVVAQRTLVTDEETTFDVTFLETNAVSTAVYWRYALSAITPATTTGAWSVTAGTYTRQLYAAVFDVIDGSNHIRFYCPSVEVTNRQDFKVANSETLTWGVTLTAYPNTSGVAVQTYIAVPALG